MKSLKGASKMVFKWNSTELNLKQILANYDGSQKAFVATKRALVVLLSNEEAYLGLPPGVIEEIKNTETETQLNNALNQVYDYADEHRIWLGL